MKRTLLFFSLVCAVLTVNAIDLAGIHILTFEINNVHRCATLSVEADGAALKLTNLFGYGKTVNGTYDETAKEVHIPAGQVVRELSDGTLRYLYTYTLNDTGDRVYDTESDIVFKVTEHSNYNYYASNQRMVTMDENQANRTSVRNVYYANYQNAILTDEVLDYQNETEVKATEEYPVYADYVSEGRYLIRNFDQRCRLFVNISRDGSVVSTYGDYPLMYSSSLQDYYFPCAFEWRNIQYNSMATDRNLYGTVEDKVLTINSIWNYILDNRNNTNVEEENRKVYRYSSDMHRNTVIKLASGHFILPHTTHEVSADELLLTTKEYFNTAYLEGWLWSGNRTDDATIIEVTNKKSTIEPGTDKIVSSTTYPGLDIKNEGNDTKNIYMRVKGIRGLKFYVTSNGSDERTAIATATPQEGEPISVQVQSGGSGAIGKLEDMDPEETYTILFYTSEGDMTLYAVQLLTETTGVEDVIVNKTLEDGLLYDLQGRRFNSIPNKGIYVCNGRKIVK